MAPAPIIACFGEVLWDILPTGKQPGGAVTCGADGALLWTNGQFYRAPGIPVQVQDTIGSGDAFLAALLKGWLTGQSPESALRFACAAGALVATHRGATPAFVEADVTALMQKQVA